MAQIEYKDLSTPIVDTGRKMGYDRAASIPGSITRGCKMGPTKVIVKGNALYDVKTGRLIKDGLATRKDQEDYALHHYIALPVLDNAGRPWLLNGKEVYCLRGTRYETSDDQVVHLVRCRDCGGMSIPDDEPTVERDCVRCTQCGHEFEARLEMMES
jgi:hypothetical protein